MTGPGPALDPEALLRPDRCYSVAQIQHVLGIPAPCILDAIRTGAIPRSLGAGLRAHVLGIDVVDWLNRRPLSR
ncbi:MAG: hypothetical protein AB7U20_20690 [Planctomycetaceae bacterium]